MTLSSWIAALGLPIFVVIGNAIVRVVAGVHQTAMADLLLTLMVFDGVVIINAKEFQPFVSLEVVKNDLVAIYVGLFVLAMFAYVIAVFWLERALIASQDQRRPFRLMWLLFLTLFGSALMLGLNTAAFA